MNARRRNRLLKRTVPTAVFTAAAVWILYSTLVSLNSTLPTNDTGVATVPLFNAWTMWWNADRLLHGFAGYWDAPIFFPAKDAFAFSEPQPATLMVAPVCWLTGSPVIAYKVYALLSLVLNGLFAYRIFRSHSVGRVLSVTGGLMMLCLPLVHQQLEVIQLVPIWGVLWTWDASRRLGRHPSLRVAVETGLAFAMTFMLSIHHGLFMAILMVPSLWVLVRRWFAVRPWAAYLTAITVAAVLVAPLVLPIRRASKTYEFHRDENQVAQLSTHPIDHLKVPENAFFVADVVQGRAYWDICVGWLKMLLAVVGLVLCALRPRLRRWTLFLLLTVVLGTIFSMGTELKLGTWQPWLTLSKWVPGVGQVRNVFRFVYFSQMAIVLLAVLGLHQINLRTSRRGVSKRVRLSTATLTSVIALAAVLEIPPSPYILAGTPNLEVHRDWCDYIRENTSEGKGIACIPFAAGTSVKDFDMSTRWMYMGTLHGKPMVNGYSGFFPAEYFAQRRLMNQTFPSEEALRSLADSQVEFVVVMRSTVSPEHISTFQSEQFRLEPVLQSAAEIDIYRLIALQTKNQQP